MRTAIIGAGIGGLATAVRLAVAGHEVTVFEKNDGPGGKLTEFSLEDYRFDLGPSLFTMPQYVDELFELAGRDPRDYFTYERLPVVCHYFWEDGTRLPAHAATEDFAAEAERVLGVEAESTLAFLRQAEKKYRLTGRIFLEKSLHRLRTWLDRDVLGAVLRIPGYDLHRSMHRVHERAFAEPKLVQLFDRFATYNGSNPYRAPGLLSMIPHFEHHFGAYLPTGGMYDISKSVHALARDLGVAFHFGTGIDEILLEKDRVSGVRIGAERLPFDRVVSNADVFFTYEKLLPTARKPERILRQQKSTSAIIFYWGIARRFSELGVHNIFFSEDYRREFADLEAGTLYADPTVYVNQTAGRVPGDAPEGHENWFVMINAPYKRDQDWDELVALTRRRTLEKLRRILGVDIEALIRAETHLDPRSIESRTGSHLGALYGTSSNSPLAAFLRHPNFSRRIDGLYFVGGSAHPGGGIPLCLLSAKITADQISPPLVSRASARAARR